jgi:hypothetical protein
MVDIYFVTSVLNIIWYVFSILFVLYRFTSFFSYVYGFVKFLGKLLEGAVYVKDQFMLFLEKRRGQYVDRRHTSPNDDLFSRIKKGTYYIFGYTHSDSILPISTTHASYYTELNSSSGPNHQDRSMFDQHIYSALRDDSQISMSTNNESSNFRRKEPTEEPRDKPTDSFISVDFNRNSNSHQNNIGVNSDMLMDSRLIQKHLGGQNH